MIHRPSLRSSHRLVPAAGAALALVAGAVSLATEPPPPPEPPLPVDQLLQIEETTESFVRALGGLSSDLARGDREGARQLFAATVRGRRFPGEPARFRPEIKWLQQGGWPLEGVAAPLSGPELVASLERFLAQFARVESISFTVLRSEVSGPELAGRVALDIRGRNRQGRREWVRGELSVQARGGAPEEWSISRFELERLESLMTLRDVFVDVTAGAAVAADDLPLAEGYKAVRDWWPNGAAAVDLDRNGLLDLFVTGQERNLLYLNRGDGTFREAAADAGLAILIAAKPEFSPVFLDYDNDGDADLFATSIHENVLLENRLVPDGRVVFRDASTGLPQFPEVQGWSAAPGDVNGDGRVDLYVPSYVSVDKGPYPRTTVDDSNGRPHLLLVNQEDGLFQEEARARGLAESRFGLGAQLADFDGDHDLDLYVTNDFGGGNGLYVNDGGRFADQAVARGAWLGAESMGSSFADYDNDGDLDLHVTNMSSVAANRILARFDGKPLRQRELLARQWSGNALLENLGDGRFRDVSVQAGPFHAEWAWGGGFLDIDNDGWEDLHTPNGFLSGKEPDDARSRMFGTVIAGMQREDRAQIERFVAPVMPTIGQFVKQGRSVAGWSHDALYLNRGDGRFLDFSGVAGADSYPSDGRSSVYADFDNDGDLDLFLRATNGRAHFLFRNDVGEENRFLRVALQGRESGTDAFGAVVRVKTPRLTLTKAKHGSNGYLGQSDPRLLFGLGQGAAEWVEVRWPSGRVQRFPGPFQDAALLVVEGEPRPRRVAEKRFRLRPPAPPPAPRRGGPGKPS